MHRPLAAALSVRLFLLSQPRLLSSLRYPFCSGGMSVEELSEAIRAAERYASLAAEVEAAQGLKERWIRRAEAQVGGRTALSSY